MNTETETPLETASPAPAEVLGAPFDGITPPTRPGATGRSLADVVVDLGFVDPARVQSAVEAAHLHGQSIGRALLEQQMLTPEQFARAIAERFGLNHLDLNLFRVDMGAANLLNPSAAKRYEAVPVAFADERTLVVAMADPANVLAIDDIAIMTGLEVRPAVASREDLAALIARLNRLDDAVAEAVEEEEAGLEEITDLRESAGDAPVIKLVNSIIAQATEQGASDIHFEPEGAEMRVRFRVDGVLSSSMTVPRRMVPGVTSRVKIMADLDISEKRVPQDGRVGLTIDGHHIDIRVVTLPTVHGEAIVMRILDKESVVIELDALGMLDTERTRFERAFSQAYGAVLVTGPTGSGKSTSLYGALNILNTPEKNIITIEDPVEYQLQGVKQVQINPKAGLTFATGLRSMMRADPDIIMVGEIRDRETAQIGIEAALTGHLVLSTLHTNDAPTAITRLIEMGIEPFLGRVGDLVRRRPAPGAPALHGLHQARDGLRRGLARQRVPRRRERHGGLRAGRVRALRRLRLQGPDRHLRGHAGDRAHPRARDRARLRRRDRPGGDGGGNGPPARRRPREDQAGHHLDRRGCPHDR